MQRGHKLSGGLIAIMVSTLTAAWAATNQVYVAFDVETTGLGPRTHRIVEIAAVRFTCDAELACWSRLVNPGRPIPASAEDVHGITDAMVRDAPAFASAYNEFTMFIADATLIAHNAPFDLRFLRAEALTCNRPFVTNQVIDTLRLARKLLPGRKSYALEQLTNDLQLPTGPHHRALADARHTMELFRRLAPKPSE